MICSSLSAAFLLVLLSLFAALALVLAGVRVYGLMAYTVARRGREIGLRMALGARAGEVLWLVVLDALRLVASGLVVGFLGAYALTRFLATYLYEVSPTDPSTFAGLALLLTLIALAASYLPAQRAARMDPNWVLRHG